ncbi:MAG: PIG-L deacetylase family protein [Bacillota bacterium]
MERRSASMVPWLVAAGAVAVAWAVRRRMQQPCSPAVARQAGLDMVQRTRRVLAIGPGPEDLERYAGGTLRLLTGNGSPVTLAVLSGEATAVPEALLLRPDLPGGEVRPGPELERALDDLWHRVQPELVLVHDPKAALGAGHNPAHLALAAGVVARARRSLAAGERLYLYATRQPNVLVEVPGAEPGRLEYFHRLT